MSRIPVTPHRVILLVLTLAAAAGGPVASASASAADVIKDCQDGKINGKYSQKDYAAALRGIPTDVDEYTDCREVISRARLGSAGGSGGSGGGAGGAAGGGVDGATGAGAPGAPDAGVTADKVLEAATPAERKQVTAARQTGGTVQVGERLVSPATSGLSPAGAANVVPAPLVAALVLLGLGLVAAAVQLIRSRVRARRHAA